MPFAFDLLDDEEQKKKDQAPANGQGAPAMTGGGSTFNGSGPGQQSSDQNKSPSGTQTQGSGFVGLDKYLSANQGNNFGSQFTGKVQGNLDSAKQGLDQSANDFTNASNQGTTRWNDVGNQVKGIVDNAGSNTSADDVSKLQGLASAKYQGPESYTGSAYGTQAQGGIQKATQEAGALQNEGGRFALLDQFYGRPNYNTGEKSLDNLLVQNGPGIAARSANIENQAQQLSGNAGQTAKNLDNVAVANRFATDDTAQQTKNYLNGAISNFGTDLSSRVKASNDQRTSDWNRILGDVDKSRGISLQNAAYDPETLKDLGLDQGQSIANVDLEKYLSENPLATAGNVATDQDYSKYLALSQLAGEDPTLLQPQNRAQAGTAKQGYSFDKNGFLSAVQNSEDSYNAAAAPIQSKMQDATKSINDAQSYFDRVKNYPPGSSEYRQALTDLNNARNSYATLADQLNSLQAQYNPNRKIDLSTVKLPTLGAAGPK